MAVLSTGASRRRALPALLPVVLVLVAASSAGAAGVGQRAPDFTLPDWQGHATALADGRGRVTIVDFWASWCTPCAPMLPALDAIAQRAEGRVRVLAVDVDQSRAKADAFLRDHLPSVSAQTTLLHDESASVLARYGAEGMPAVFVVDAEGTIRFTEVGYSPEHLGELERIVQRLASPEEERGRPVMRSTATRTPSAARVTVSD